MTALLSCPTQWSSGPTQENSDPEEHGCCLKRRQFSKHLLCGPKSQGFQCL